MGKRYAVTLLVEGEEATTLEQVRTLVAHRVDDIAEALGMPVLDTETVRLVELAQ